MQYNEDYFNSEDFKELLDSYETALQAGEQPFMDADDLVDLADYYNYNGEGDKAAEAIERALDLYPDSTLPNVFKAREALAMGDCELAHHYAESIGDHDDPDYHYLTAEIMIAEGISRRPTIICASMPRASTKTNGKTSSRTAPTSTWTMASTTKPTSG